MYSVSQLLRGVKSPALFGRELNRLYHTRLRTRDHNTAGIDVFAEDWDNLIILDACRYDTFKHHSTLPGRLEKRVSRGACTLEFLRGNFRDRDLTHTVYVTGNPQIHEYWDELQPRLHDIIDLWDSDHWDDEYNTVLPETVTEHAMKAAADYPDKRLVIHYMQPHFPFVRAEEVNERLPTPGTRTSSGNASWRARSTSRLTLPGSCTNIT